MKKYIPDLLALFRIFSSPVILYLLFLKDELFLLLSSTIIELDSLSKDVISSMLEESEKELNQENLDDKKRYIISHKIDCLSQISL